MQIRYLLAILTLAGTAGCTTLPSGNACAVGDAMVRTELYFGLEKKEGDITPKQWTAFVEREVAPRFPEGFSVIDARGAWFNREHQRTIHENSKIVVRLHAGTPEQERAIGEIIALYRARFAQESVMRIDAPACAAF
jgi:hypothetical protein